MLFLIRTEFIPYERILEYRDTSMYVRQQNSSAASLTCIMGKPRVSRFIINLFCQGNRIDILQMIILIRHAQSEGNSELQTFKPPSRFKPNCRLPQIENRDIHQTVPDHRVKLTPDGWKQVRSRCPP